jgi:hypothetical protein
MYFVAADPKRKERRQIGMTTETAQMKRIGYDRMHNRSGFCVDRKELFARVNGNKHYCLSGEFYHTVRNTLLQHYFTTPLRSQLIKRWD